MFLADPELPAARYLAGDDAIDVLRVPVEASGGTIASARPVHVQYRPGSDVVVRYSAQVSWNGEPPSRETLVAASAVHGSFPGVVPITADTPYGRVTVGVWRWPFDPVLTGLGDVVTASGVAALMGDDDPRSLRVAVVAFRPTERAVIAVTRHDRALAYVKAVVPSRTTGIERRHAALRAVEVPAPDVVLADADRGLLVLQPLHGATLRDLVKAGSPGWPDGDEYLRLTDAISSASISGSGPPSRLGDGALHAAMLATVLPGERGRLDELAARFEAVDAPPTDGTVHGDLHEGQIIVDAGRIVGLLDVDDAGPGASVDDMANVIARIVYRAVTAGADRRQRLDRYAAAVREAARARHDEVRLDIHIAAALVGLATGPFRVQSPDWRATVGALLGRADELSR